jgi:hypothetical protein
MYSINFQFFHELVALDAHARTVSSIAQIERLKGTGKREGLRRKFWACSSLVADLDLHDTWMSSRTVIGMSTSHIHLYKCPEFGQLMDELNAQAEPPNLLKEKPQWVTFVQLPEQ